MIGVTTDGGRAAARTTLILATLTAVSLGLSACGPTGKVMTHQVVSTHPQAMIACELPRTRRCSISAVATGTTYTGCYYIKHVRLQAQKCLDHGGTVTQADYQRLLGSP